MFSTSILIKLPRNFAAEKSRKSDIDGAMVRRWRTGVGDAVGAALGAGVGVAVGAGVGVLEGKADGPTAVGNALGCGVGKDGVGVGGKVGTFMQHPHEPAPQSSASNCPPTAMHDAFDE